MDIEQNYEMIKLRKQDLVDNPMTRVPVCFCIDTSGSMNVIDGGDGKSTGQIVERDGKKYIAATGGKSRIEQVNEGIIGLFESIRKDEVAQYSVELAIVTFDSQAKQELDFANIERQGDAPIFKAESSSGGNTFMGEGVNLALNRLEARKQEYKDMGVDYFQPWLVIMTDGEANGSMEEQKRAIHRIQQMVDKQKLVVFPIAMGSDASMNILAEYSPNRTPIKIRDLKYREFFEFISDNLIAKSKSTAGEKIEIRLEDIRGWGEL